MDRRLLSKKLPVQYRDLYPTAVVELIVMHSIFGQGCSLSSTHTLRLQNQEGASLTGSELFVKICIILRLQLGRKVPAGLAAEITSFLPVTRGTNAAPGGQGVLVGGDPDPRGSH